VKTREEASVVVVVVAVALAGVWSECEDSRKRGAKGTTVNRLVPERLLTRLSLVSLRMALDSAAAGLGEWFGFGEESAVRRARFGEARRARPFAS
jgi:hypothetical protein